jgi:hypothetical protein
MAKTLYSFYRKSERAYTCSLGHVHDVHDYKISVEDDEYEMMLQEFPDSLSETPWVNINNSWERSLPEKDKNPKKDK